jgi:hypothetical protein
MTALYGAQSLSSEQMNWLTAHLASVPSGHTKLLFYHYDFGGTLANGMPGAEHMQIVSGALGADGLLWGHYHTVPEGNLAARPFNLGLQAVIDGLRTFRILRVSNGVVTPGPMHHSGGTATTPTDSLTVQWSGANDGSLSTLSALVTNRFAETWEHARLLFRMANAGTYAATGGTIVQRFTHDGATDVEVELSAPASGSANVTVTGSGASVEPRVPGQLVLERPFPNPFTPTRGALAITFDLPAASDVELGIYDLGGRRIDVPLHAHLDAGPHGIQWAGATGLAPGIYVVRLRAGSAQAMTSFVLVQ